VLQRLYCIEIRQPAAETAGGKLAIRVRTGNVERAVASKLLDDLLYDVPIIIAHITWVELYVIVAARVVVDKSHRQ
jgi:hypothetical protein